MNKKVLVLTSSYPMYKGDTNSGFVHELSKRLTYDFDVFVVAPWQKKLAKIEIIDNVKIYRYKQFPVFNIELAYGSDILAKMKKNFLYYFVVPFFLLMQFLKLINVIKKEKINIIHAHWLLPQAFISVLYKILINRKIKILVTIHGADIYNFQNFAGKAIKKFVLNYIEKVSVVSHAIKNEVIKLGFNKEIFVYPMGINTKTFSPEKRKQSLRDLFDIKKAFLLFVGGIIERKGIRYLIKAMPRILEKFPEAKLVVVGEGNLETEMINLCKDLKIALNVIFTGKLPNKQLPEYYATADLFILPSLSEGFGLVVAESLSCETLAVSSNLNSLNDIIIENKTGFYFKNINEEEISNKIIEILEQIDNFEIIKKQGRRHIEDNFSWIIEKRNYIELLSSLFS